MTRASFLMSLSKGEFAEQIIKGKMEARGFVVYRPTTDRAHAFDILAIKDKEKCIAIDVKAKARRVAMLASRSNMMLSIPMLFFMANGFSHRAVLGL